MRFDVTVPANLPTVQLESLIAEANAIDVVNKGCADALSSILQDIIAFERAAEKDFRSIKDPINEAAKAADRIWRPTRDLCEAGKALCKSKIGAYIERERRKRLELESEQRETARKEQERIQLEAAQREERGREEAQRLREQAAAQADAGNAAAAADLKAGAERAEMGAQQDAQLLLEQAQQVIPLSVPEPKVAGITQRTLWRWEGVDLDATILACCPRCNAQQRVTRGVLTWNEDVLSRMASALKEEFNVPGVTAMPVPSTAVTGK